MPNLDRFNDDAFRRYDRLNKEGSEGYPHEYGEPKTCVVCERKILRGHMCASCRKESGEDDDD